MTPKLAAVIFDMDGLMLDTERLACAAWKAALSEAGYPYSEALMLAILGRTTEGTRATFLQTFGPTVPFERLIERKRQYVRDEIDQQGLVAKAGLLELLDWLEAQRLARAVASSAQREDVLHKLNRAGLTARFDAILTGDQVQHGKPAPDIFLAAAQELGVAPAACAVLEDSDAGIWAAAAAGMLPLMVPDIKPPAPESLARAHRIFRSLHEAKDFLETLVAL